jgi:hypothetical protein
VSFRKLKKIDIRFSSKTLQSKIKRIPRGIHKTFAEAKIKLASGCLQIKQSVIALQAVLLHLAVQWYLPSSKWYCPAGSDMFVRCTNVFGGYGQTKIFWV